jgi:acetoin utilization deacetylase AcuC-like enzyme
MSKVGYAWDTVFGWAEPTAHPFMAADFRRGVQPYIHFAHPDTKRRSHELIEVTGLMDHLERIKGRQATEEEILQFHDKDYHDRIRSLSDADGGTAGDPSASIS